MVFVDDGIASIQNTGIRNVSGQTPTYLIFAGSDNTYLGTESSMSEEFIRKEVSWAQTGIQSKFTVQLNSVEVIGSDIQATGLVGTSGIGTGSLFTVDSSFIGEKTNTFNVQVTGEVFVRRPNF